MKKKIIMLIAILTIAVMSGVMFTGCGFSGGEVSNQSELYGRWRLVSTRWSSGFMCSTSSVGSNTNHYILFNDDGTFSENNYWQGTQSGTWTFDASSSTITLSGRFGHSRTVQINNDGDRIQLEFDALWEGANFSYRNVYQRA